VIGKKAASDLTLMAVAAWEAAIEFTALAKGSPTTRIAPRQSNPAVKLLLDRILDTSVLQSAVAHPMSELDAIHAWNLSVLKVGHVYCRAGTEGPSGSLSGLGAAEQMDRNIVEFASEMGRYIDAQLSVQAALVATVSTFLATASKSELSEYANLKAGYAEFQAWFARTITGATCLLIVEGLTDAWRRERAAAIAAVRQQAARCLSAKDLSALGGIAAEAASRISDHEVKTQLISLVAEIDQRRD
jgi:hypothetical protein